MKRIVSLFLVFVLMASTVPAAFAASNKEAYYTVPVEYSDNVGYLEELDLMIQNGHVFVDGEMLAESLGYDFHEDGEVVAIYNEDTSNGLPYALTIFRYDSTQVSHLLFKTAFDVYEAPFASVKNSNGSWIPFEYALLILNSGMMITEKALLIDAPDKRIIDYFRDISNNIMRDTFDWENDFGYTGSDIKLLGGNSHLINVFNGLLSFDGPSWAAIFQQFAGSMDSYDKKYGQDLAMLLCTESDKELQASIDEVNRMIDVLSDDGELGSVLSRVSENLDSDVGTLYKHCEDVMEAVKSGNAPLLSYNRSYQALEKAMDRQTWFSSTGGNILEVQKGVSSATGDTFDFLEAGTKVLEVVGYMQEFQNQDEFSLAALKYYLDKENGGLELPVEMKKSMTDYADELSSSLGEYTTKRFKENVGNWIMDGLPMEDVLGAQGAGLLFAWNLASDLIPFVSNGLASADNFELALYAMLFQGDTLLNYLSKRDEVLADAEEITPENLYKVAQYCYIYQKACYTTREAALASLANKTKSTKEKIQPLVDYQNGINEEIAKIMVKLKGANKTNAGYVYGFLPMDNEEYLEIYDDSLLIQWVENLVGNQNGNEAEIYTQYLLSGGYGELVEYDQEDRLEISACLVDLDDDGIKELLISLIDQQSSGPRGRQATTALLDIQNNTVKTVHSAYNGGGTMGGEQLALKYDLKQQKYVLVLAGLTRDGMNEGITYLNIYSEDLKEVEQETAMHYINIASGIGIYLEVAEEVRSETDLVYMDGDYQRHYTIDGEYVTDKEYSAIEERFVDPNDHAYQMKPGTYQNPIGVETGKQLALSEEELLIIMQDKSGQQIQKYVFVDMDHDGSSELIGVCNDDGDRIYKTWYCSSDGEICKLVQTGSESMEECNIEVLPIGEETHLVINGYRLMGTMKEYSILALHDKEIECEVLNHYGYTSMSEDGDILLNVEAYDGGYDPTINATIGHTWKDTYLYYDGHEYKEYGATQISEKSFLQFKNAQAIKDAISSELMTSGILKIEYTFFKRPNGIIHIQNEMYYDSGIIDYGYYTVRYSNSTLDADTIVHSDGRMFASFSNLDVTY